MVLTILALPWHQSRGSLASGPGIEVSLGRSPPLAGGVRMPHQYNTDFSPGLCSALTNLGVLFLVSVGNKGKVFPAKKNSILFQNLAGEAFARAGTLPGQLASAGAHC